jgi:hypothetical protein
LEQFRQLWGTLAEHISKVAERTQDLSADQLRFIAALACLAFFLVLVAWVGTVRKLRRMRTELIEAQAQSKELQVKYDAEVKWRTAAERVEAANAARTAPPLTIPLKVTQQTTGLVASAQLQAVNRARAILARISHRLV